MSLIRLPYMSLSLLLLFLREVPSRSFIHCSLAMTLHLACSARRSSVSVLQPLQDDPGFLADFLRLFGYAEVEYVSAPLNPADGEQIVAVEYVTIDEAAQRFYNQDRGDIAELYLLANELRGTT